MEEREISIVDLLVEILLRWRMMLVWMVVGAVLLGAFSYVRSGNAAKEQKAQSSEMMQDPEEWLTEEEIQNVKYVADYEKMYLEKVAYQENSPLMQIDANNVNKAETTIAVVAEDPGKGSSIEAVYEDIAESSECIAKAAEDAGVETVGAGEILYVVKSNSSVYGLESDSGKNVFKIVAMHGDEETCRKMAESAVAFLKEKQPEIERSLGRHEVIVASESFGAVSDLTVAERQKMVLNDVATMKKTLSDAKTALTENEQSYYAYLASSEEAETGTEEPVEKEAAPSAGISKKYVLLGAVMAAFLYAFILLLIYIFNTKIRATDSLQELYGLPQLGMIPKEPGGKRFLGVVDQWILSIRDHNKRQFAPEEALELASVAAKMAAGKEALQEICLLGCGLKERSLEACEKMKGRLEEDGIRVTILNNVLYDAQMLEELEKAKGAVLVESAGATLYTEIAGELDLLKRQGIRVLGGILVE